MSSVLKDFSDATTALVRETARRVVSLNGRERGSLSGIVIRPGIIVTAEEALERDGDVEVTLPDGQAATASVVGRDPTTDIAVLRVSGADIAAAPGAARPEPGAIVVGVGRVGKDVVAALGSLAHVGDAWHSSHGGLIELMIRADITLRPATEGGALVDAGVPKEHAEVYSEAIRRGGTLVTVRAEDAQVARVNSILDQHMPIDPAARREEYRKAGWKGYDPKAEPYTLSDAERERIRAPYSRS